MTFAGAIGLFLVMAALAAVPSSSVLLVVSQSAAIGLRNGVATAAGVVVGDLIFVAMAVLGMSALATQMGGLFVGIRYLAGVYLIWFGLRLIRRHRKTAAPAEAPLRARGRGLSASFAAGLLLTLGDIKAIFFYASLLPAFLDLGTLSVFEIALVCAITVVAVGGVKLAYAFGAGRAARLAGGAALARPLKVATGGLMIGAGAFVVLRD